MSWNNIQNSEKLSMWKKLREGLVGKELEGQLNDIAKFFSDVPYGSRSIDYFTPSSWHGPWEMLYHGCLCKSAIAVLMYYTLVMNDQNSILELYLIDDNIDEYLIFVVNGIHVLNYEYNEISDYNKIKNGFALKKVYGSKDIRILH